MGTMSNDNLVLVLVVQTCSEKMHLITDEKALLVADLATKSAGEPILHPKFGRSFHLVNNAHTHYGRFLHDKLGIRWFYNPFIVKEEKYTTWVGIGPMKISVSDSDVEKKFEVFRLVMEAQYQSYRQDHDYFADENIMMKFIHLKPNTMHYSLPDFGPNHNTYSASVLPAYSYTHQQIGLPPHFVPRMCAGFYVLFGIPTGRMNHDLAYKLGSAQSMRAVPFGPNQNPRPFDFSLLGKLNTAIHSLGVDEMCLPENVHTTNMEAFGGHNFVRLGPIAPTDYWQLVYRQGGCSWDDLLGEMHKTFSSAVHIVAVHVNEKLLDHSLIYWAHYTQKEVHLYNLNQNPCVIVHMEFDKVSYLDMCDEDSDHDDSLNEDSD